MLIYESLRAMRKKSGKTQAQIATHIGVSTRTWKNYEYGVSEIRAVKLIYASIYCHYDIISVLQTFMPKSIATTANTNTLDPNKKPSET